MAWEVRVKRRWVSEKKAVVETREDALEWIKERGYRVTCINIPAREVFFDYAPISDDQ